MPKSPAFDLRIPDSFPPTKPASRGFEDVERLTTADGIVAIISQKARDGSLTFGMHREFLRDGRMDRGSFIPEHMGASYLSMVGQALARMKVLREEEENLVKSGKPGKLPFAIRTRTS